MLPLNAIIWTIMERFQSKQMIMKDERVRVITEILAGVKVLKLFSWEDSFINKIGGFKLLNLCNGEMSVKQNYNSYNN